MKRVMVWLSTVLVLASAAGRVDAGAAHLTVIDCGGASSSNWTCVSNSGYAVVLVASYVADVDVRPIAHETIIDFYFDVAVPPWWRVGTGECRLPASLSVDLTPTRGGGSCLDFFGTVPGGAIGSYEYRAGPVADGVMPGGPVDANKARLVVRGRVDSVAAAQSDWPAPGDEVFLFTIVVNKARTAGDGACAGCTTPACVQVRSVSIEQPAPRGVWGVSNADAWMMTLQGGLWECYVATNRTTWGQVKALYR